MKKICLFFAFSLLFISMLDAKSCNCKTQTYSVIYDVPTGTGCKGATVGNGGTVTFYSALDQAPIVISISTEDGSNLCY